MGISDHEWMQRALAIAQRGAMVGEVPVGAVLVKGGVLLAEAHNQPIACHDPTAHAEISVLRKAAELVGNYRLVDTTLFVTLEPCLMCVGALIHARVKRLVFGAYDGRAGAVVSQSRLLDANFINHKIVYEGGILATESAALLSQFFKQKRACS